MRDDTLGSTLARSFHTAPTAPTPAMLRSTSVGSAITSGSTTTTAPSVQSRRAIAKLTFSPRDDHRILIALAHYPDSRHSAMLAGWLRAGWRAAIGAAAGQRFVAPAPASALVAAPTAGSTALPLQPLIRRVFVDAAIDPALADYLGGLPRHERGREIRHLIGRALLAAATSNPSNRRSPAC